jgi:hypothetical protein
MKTRSPVQQLDKLREHLVRLHRTRTWRDIARDFPDVPAGTLCAIANGRDPKKPGIRKSLGLPYYLPALACARCGQVHVSKRCLNSLKRQNAKKRDWRGLALMLSGLIAMRRLV